MNGFVEVPTPDPFAAERVPDENVIFVPIFAVFKCKVPSP